MELVVLYVLLAVLVGAFSRSKGHSFIAGTFFAILLSPLIAGIIVALRSPNTDSIEGRTIATGTMKKCPSCAELIKKEATKCRYCGELLVQ